MRNYQVTITGTTPLLMHWDNIDWADQMSDWKDDPANKGDGKAGDDRTPAWRWIGSTYHDGERVTIPSDNLMKAMMEAGAMVPVPGGRGGKTFKSQTQSGMMINESDWPLLIGNKEVPYAPIASLMKEKDFFKHKAAVEKLGFQLFVKRASIKRKKHIRVRPRFNEWSLRGSVTVWDDKITDAVFADFWRYAGQYKGLGDWRPGNDKPGSFGMFTAEVKRVS